MASEKKSPAYRGKIFKNGRSQAIRLPKEVRFDDSHGEVRVRRDGKRLVIEPVDDWSDAFLETEGSVPDMPRPPRRTPLSKARDRLG